MAWPYGNTTNPTSDYDQPPSIFDSLVSGLGLGTLTPWDVHTGMTALKQMFGGQDQTKQAAQKPAAPPANWDFGSAAPSPAPIGSDIQLRALQDVIMGKESSGRPGVQGADVGGGVHAQGLFQLLPSTAKATAEQHGIPWQPSLMTGTSQEAAQYQDTLGRLHVADNYRISGGDPAATMALHFAGPNTTGWKGKTAQYVRDGMNKYQAAVQSLLSTGAAIGGTLPGTPNPAAAYSAPSLAYANPAAVAGMIPNPVAIPHVGLPAAPQAEAPTPIPEAQGIPQSMLDAYRQAVTPIPWEQTPEGQNAKRLQTLALASGIARGAANADTIHGGIGGLIASALGGGLVGRNNAEAQQIADQQQYSDLMRQVQAQIAGKTYDAGLKNIDVANTNSRQDALNDQAQKDSRFNNAQRTYQNLVDNIRTNLGIDESNVGTQNTTNMARANAAISALGTAIGTTNQAATEQRALDQTAQTNAVSGTAMNNQVSTMLQQIGIQPKQSRSDESALESNAHDAAAAIVANNANLAKQTLAQELLLSGDYQTELDKKTVQAIKLAIQNKDQAGAMSIAVKAMANPQDARIVAQRMAARGRPAATLIIQHLK